MSLPSPRNEISSRNAATVPPCPCPIAGINLPHPVLLRATRTRSPRVAVFVDKTSRYGRGVLQGVADYLEVHGPWRLQVDLQALGEPSGDWLKNWSGDGILGFVATPLLAEQMRQSKIPAVESFWHRFDLQLPQVVNDDALIGQMAAEHLQQRRFRHFAFFGYSETPWSDRRLAGYQAKNAQAGFGTCSFFCLHESGSLARWEQTQPAVVQWLESLPKPVGLMACSDRLALRVLGACQHAGIPVPEQIAVIGVDNDEETCRLATLPLTSVMDNPRRIGSEAAHLLDELMARSQPAPAMAPILIPPMGVATRRSTDATAIADPLVARAVRLIRERACQGLTVKSLLPELHVSQTTLYERFGASLGLSPHRQILRVKLERVKDLLSQTNLCLEQIAEQTGFEHPEYLQVAFKREVGMTPGSYRRRR